MNIEKIKEEIAGYNPEALFADGYDEAIIGFGGQHGSNTVVIYDSEKCIEILAEQFAKDGSDEPYIEAADYFGYNTACAYVGENTPIFISRFFDV